MARLARRQIAAYVATALHEGGDPHALARMVAAYLIEQRQTAHLELLIRDIEANMMDKYGVAAIRIKSARPLTEALRQALVVFIQSYEGTTQVVVTEEQVDSSLIGGVIIQTPTGTFDSSIKAQLRQLTTATKE